MSHVNPDNIYCPVTGPLGYGTFVSHTGHMVLAVSNKTTFLLLVRLACIIITLISMMCMHKPRRFGVAFLNMALYFLNGALVIGIFLVWSYILALASLKFQLPQYTRGCILDRFLDLDVYTSTLDGLFLHHKNIPKCKIVE